MLTLDQALKEASDRIDGRVAAKTKIAPLNFNSPHDKFSGYVLDEITANLVDSGKLTVVDRKEVDLIRGEFDFQFSGEVGDDSMQQLGRMLGAQSIISGSLTDMGGFYRIVIRVLNVQTASVEVQYRANIADDKVMAALLTGGKTAVAVRSPQRTPVAQTPAASAPSTPVSTPAVPPTPIYKIGDKGPAGGLIFYDKGNNSGGWRYLEAAPTDIGRKLYATEEAVKIQTERTVGTGKSNTQNIMAQANNRGGGFGWAAQACDALVVNGFSDWFLPSRDELHYMYGNLHMRNLGGFSLDWYWSSTFDSDYHDRNEALLWWSENFSDGGQKADVGNRGAYPYLTGPAQQFRIRACRQF